MQLLACTVSSHHCACVNYVVTHFMPWDPSCRGTFRVTLGPPVELMNSPKAYYICNKLLLEPRLGRFHRVGLRTICGQSPDDYMWHADEAVRMYEKCIRMKRRPRSGLKTSKSSLSKQRQFKQRLEKITNTNKPFLPLSKKNVNGSSNRSWLQVDSTMSIGTASQKSRRMMTRCQELHSETWSLVSHGILKQR